MKGPERCLSACRLESRWTGENFPRRFVVVLAFGQSYRLVVSPVFSLAQQNMLHRWPSEDISWVRMQRIESKRIDGLHRCSCLASVCLLWPPFGFIYGKLGIIQTFPVFSLVFRSSAKSSLLVLTWTVAKWACCSLRLPRPGQTSSSWIYAQMFPVPPPPGSRTANHLDVPHGVLEWRRPPNPQGSGEQSPGSSFQATFHHDRNLKSWEGFRDRSKGRDRGGGSGADQRK